MIKLDATEIAHAICEWLERRGLGVNPEPYDVSFVMENGEAFEDDVYAEIANVAPPAVEEPQPS